jgi:hypothetical protein
MIFVSDDADLLLAQEAEPVLRQVLTVSPGVQEFVKAITKKHLQSIEPSSFFDHAPKSMGTCHLCRLE